MTFSTHYSTLLRKNYLLFKTGWFGSVCEILTPILFCYILIFIKNSQDVINISQISSFNIPRLGDLTWELGSTDYLKFGPFRQANRVMNMSYFDKCEQNNLWVAITPASGFLNAAFKTRIQSFTNLNIKDFGSNEEMNQYMYLPDYAEKNSANPGLCFGIIFNEYENGKYDYTLRYNLTMRPGGGDRSDFPETSQERILLTERQNFLAQQEYLQQGVYTIQGWMHEIIIQKETSDSNAKITTTMVPFAIPAYTEIPALRLLQDQTNLFICLPILIPFCRFLYFLLKEKEYQIKEYMKIMGLNETAYYASWLTHYTLVFAFIGLVCSWEINIGSFTASNFLLIYLWVFLFYCVQMARAIFFCSLFTRAKYGIILGIVLYFIEEIILDSFLPNPETLTMGQHMLASLSASYMMKRAGYTIVAFEIMGSGLNFQTITQDYQGYKVIYCFYASILYSFIFVILGIYLEQIIPREFGFYKHPFYLCKRKKQFTSAQVEDLIKSIKKQKTSKFFENVTAQLQQQEATNDAILISDLDKKFKNGGEEGVHAVQGVNLTMYKGQITALLGHNGAGKTTTVNMLVGMLKPTKGNAFMLGYDIKTNMQAIRKDIGFCPQHDILFEQFTILEHLQIFGKFRNMSKEQTENQIQQLLTDLHMEEFKDRQVRYLSGGEKRKLSVALAFMGDPKIIFLDEPTSGLDIQGKRLLWDVLKKYKAGRIIILVTHYMDEADTLGDRIYIMGDGHVMTCGTPSFLKSTYGVGYSLNIVKKDSGDSEKLKQYIKKIIPKAILEIGGSKEMTFKLPLNDTDKFNQLFSGLDSRKEEFSISDYGISVTTLEEVFLKVAAGRRVASIKPDIVTETHEDLENPIWLDNIQEKEQAKDQILQKIQQKSQKQKQQKQQQQHVQQLGILDCKIILQQPLKQQHIKQKKDEARVYSPEEIEILNKELDEIRVKSQCRLFWMQFGAMFKKKYHYFKRDKRGICCEIFLPILFLLLPIYFNKVKPTVWEPTLAINENMYPKPQDVLISNFNNAASTEFLNLFNTENVKIELVNDQDLLSFEKTILDKRQSKQIRLGSFAMQNVDKTNNQYAAAIFINTTAQESGMYFSNVLISNILQYATSNPNAKVSMTIEPFAITQELEARKASGDIIIYIVLSIIFIPGMVAGFIVYERETEVKHQQIVSGVFLSAYWLGNFVQDYTKFLFFVIIAPCIIVWLDSRVMIEDGNLTYFILCVIVLGFSLISFAYLVSFMFKTVATAQIFLFLLSFITGFVMPLVFFIFNFFPSLKIWARNLSMISRIFFPTFCFGDSLFRMATRQLIQQLDQLPEYPSVWSYDVNGWNFLFLLVQNIYFWIIIIILENIKHIQCLSNLFLKSKLKQPSKIPNEDQDVIDARKKSINTKPSQTSIKIERLRKVFKSGLCSGHKVAVNDISFTIPEGECFALLGINGAGKTSIFKMLTGDINMTSGVGYVKGYKIPQQMQLARQLIGYCPQGNVIIGNLTGKEHLDLFATIKGIPERYRDLIVENKIQEMGLEPYQGHKDQTAGSYSGGNKRKLQVAIALIGNPPIVFLDEPSKGMDPEARRFMWKIIDRISTFKKQSTVLLTTHSMEEAEGLCSRIAILVNGSLKCIGPIQRLKNKFGKGYELEIKINDPTKEIIQKIIEGQDPNKSISESQVKKTVNKIAKECGANEVKAQKIISEISDTGFGSEIQLAVQLNSFYFNQEDQSWYTRRIYFYRITGQFYSSKFECSGEIVLENKFD